MQITPIRELEIIRLEPLTIDWLVTRYAISNQAEGKSTRTIAW